MTQAQLIAKAVAAALAGSAKPQKGRRKGRKGAGRVKSDDATLKANAERNAKEAEALFEKLGFKDNRANETILTYKRWMEKGRKVKPGEKSHKTGAGYPLFHLDQTEEVVPAQTN